MGKRTSHGLYFVGLLLLAHTAQSFVLLTANMEDIKKLARKFVSDSLADKIAEFIVTATSQVTNQGTNVSEENEFHGLDNSGDNGNYKLRKIARQKEDKQIQSPKKTFVKEYKSKIVKNEPRSVEATPKNWEMNSHEEFIKKLNRFEEIKSKNRYKGKNEVYSDRNSEDERPKETPKYSEPAIIQQYHPDKQHQPPTNYQEPNEMEFEKYKQNKKNGVKPFVSAYRSPKLDPNLLDEDQSVSDGRHHPTPNHIKPNFEHKVGELSSEESNDTKSEYLKQNQAEIGTTRFRSRALNLPELTTRKEKTDFDQYDNPKYPKAQLVGTSGPVMLPKVPGLNNEESWWKEAPPLEI